MSWSSLWEFFAKNWGNVASVVGVGISIGILFIAKRAKAAAEDAKRESRRRNLSEDLRDAQTKADQIGIFLRDRKWDLVFLRSQEVASVCGTVLHRWTDEMNGHSQTQIRSAREQAKSISRVAMQANAPAHVPSEQQLRTVEAAQRKLSEVLSAELGAALSVVERSVQPDE